MKNRISIAIVSIMLGLFLTGCKDDEELNFAGEIDSEYLEALADGRESGCFSSYEVVEFIKNKNTNKWEKYSVNGRLVNGDELEGWSSTLKQLQICDGKMWGELELFTLAGPHLLYLPWTIYCEVTGFNKKIYVANKITYKKSENILKYGGMRCKIERAEKDFINLSIETSYCLDNEWLPKKELYRFSRKELNLPNADELVEFPSVWEAELKMIEMMREVFGDVLHVADYQHLFPYNIGNAVYPLDEMEEYFRPGFTY